MPNGKYLGSFCSASGEGGLWVKKRKKGDLPKSRTGREKILIPFDPFSVQHCPNYLMFCLQGILSLEYCVGIIGGKPKQSYYFAGFQGQYFNMLCLFNIFLQELGS